MRKQQQQPLAWYAAEHWIEHEAGERQTLTVIEDEPKPIETGLLDLHGNKLYRCDMKGRIGFKWRD